MISNHKHFELTGKIIGCAIKIHSNLGNFLPAEIYQRCLAMEMKKQDFAFKLDVEMPVVYDVAEVGKRRIDLLIEDKIMIQIKTAPALTEWHMEQVSSYLAAYKLETALLINFGTKTLEFKRITTDKPSKTLHQ
jgi:GxxExxY protein